MTFLVFDLLFAGLCFYLVVLDAYYLAYWIASLFYQKGYESTENVKTSELVVIIPAHNEERVIGNTVRALKGFPCSRIIVIADHCEDGTETVAVQNGAEVWPIWEGAVSTKGIALAKAFEQLRKEKWDYVMVLDADNHMPETAQRQIPSLLETGPEVVQLEVRPGNCHKSINTRMITVLYGFLNRVIQRGRSVFGQNALLCGTGMIFRRDIVLDKVPWKHDLGLVEDISYQQRLTEAGVKISWVEKAWVDDEKPQSMKAGIVQSSRWLRGRSKPGLQTLKRFRQNPLRSAADFWTLMPKPIFLLSALVLLCAPFSSFSWKVPGVITILPVFLWLMPSCVYGPYRVGPWMVFYPFWQIGTQVSGIIQAVRDRGRGWRHTEHFGQ